jgi:hypothetical protein
LLESWESPNMHAGSGVIWGIPVKGRYSPADCIGIRKERIEVEPLPEHRPEPIRCWSSSLKEGNETTLQSRRKVGKGAAPQDGGVKAWQCAKDRAQSLFVR